MHPSIEMVRPETSTLRLVAIRLGLTQLPTVAGSVAVAARLTVLVG